jgi:50S ribosomal subunit-associated GTPase HflX
VEVLLAELDLERMAILRVFNKADKVEAAFAKRICQRFGGIAISALDTGTFSPLLHEIEEILWGKKKGVIGTATQRGRGPLAARG